MKKKYLVASLCLLAQRAFAERGVNVDVGGFMDATRDIGIQIGGGLVVIAVILMAIGLMVPGFRETTKRSMPWIVFGISLIVLVTKYWR